MGRKTHPFLPNSSDRIRQRMLAEIGLSSLEELYSDIPLEVRLKKPLRLAGFSSEQEVRDHIDAMLQRNKSARDNPVFLGAGVYNHYIPAAVKAILSRTEFQTSYTPYQAEVSQGLLQGLFEFQSLVADLAQVDVVNSSLYDWSSAIGEAARMASRATGRKKILAPRCIHPDKSSVLKNYTLPAGIRVQTYDYDDVTGGVDLSDLTAKLDSDTAAVYAELPSLFGILDPQIPDIPAICHEKGALAIVGFDLVSLGGIRPPGDYGSDIVVAEGQCISTEMNYGGPSLGIIGCRDDNLVRQMPGRLIGMTSTIDGSQRAFSMVLQTREQHIRRERATSNICTNEALLAIGASAYLSLMGPSGLRQLFETVLTKTQYAMSRLQGIPRITVPKFSGTHYQDFVVSVKGERGSAEKLQKKLMGQGIQCGKRLKEPFPELGESLLLSVTELNTQESIDALGSTVAKLLEV